MRLGVIGFGNMGSAIARAVKKHFSDVIVYDVSQEKSMKALEEGFGVAKDLKFMLANSDFVLLAVKPKDVPSVLTDLDLGDRVLISIVAGLTLDRLYQLVGHDKKIIRTMPNINVLVGKGVMAYVFGENLTEYEKEFFLKSFSSCASLYPIEEGMMDSFTAIAGSGPAFVFKFISALSLAGVREGFSYELAKSIVIDTILGSCELLKSMGGHPEEWIAKVASPAGITIEGIKVLEERGFSGIVMECIEKTSQKAKRL
ncbi:pyrroline-5-carboxylate reductase [Thermocrinis minervae]|uniref:Pyrroline-5-carboxylate reductase n=1 Tax=Thermocrinis minervae TaxID=381751 RepID=A0A1M6SKV4_9AQUI|nr:pyrroline-5-carboxylate reductase [Thermocrinis minervae]SHK45371.1 pyrroline-5-carboxylate reductase [Thermocrinis minervae]